jgi:hypothetical protein
MVRQRHGKIYVFPYLLFPLQNKNKGNYAMGKL